MKLYPPVIDNKIPAFYGDRITIPFTLNKAVSINQLKGAALLIKSAETNELIIKSNKENIFPIRGAFSTDYSQVVFSGILQAFKMAEKDNLLIAGQYYKIQIALIDETDTIGYYSNVGVTRYLGKKKTHKIYIDNLKKGINIYSANYIYQGCYQPPKQLPSEILYSYYFNLYDSDSKTILDSSGIQINTTEVDENNIITNTWYTSYKLKPYKNYYIEFGGTTLNGLALKSTKYRIQSPDTIDLDIDADFLAELDYENGCIDISLQADSRFNSMIKYKFLVSRASDKDNYTTWEPIMRDIKSFNPEDSDANITLEDTPTFHIWTDYTIEQGVSYIYALQAYNDNQIFSNPIYSNRIKILDTEIESIITKINNLKSKETYDVNLGQEISCYIIDHDLIRFARIHKVEKQDSLSILNRICINMYNRTNITDYKNDCDKLSNFLKKLQTSEKDIYGRAIPILADFEHAYLFDGKRQLKLAFNPKVSSFKNTVLETKVDTLGGKYPFFFRNAKVKYKEFPISGLISCLMDEDDKFLTGVNQFQLKTHNADGTVNILNLYDNNTSLTSTNIYKERNFKAEVLEWLTDGQPKIFRSPTEGNFIVRLMNTSLTPNDTLGRMLHTFSCTAYEMADYSFDNLREYGFADIDLTLLDKTIYICQTTIKDGSQLSFSKNLKYLKCEITNPHQAEVELNVYYKNDSTKPVAIKFRGAYMFPAGTCDNIIGISILPKKKRENDAVLIEYEPIEVIWAYETPPPSNNFNYIKNITLSEESAQFIGGLGRLGEDPENDKKIWVKAADQKDIIQDLLQNVEREVGQVNYLKIYRRHIKDCWYNEYDKTKPRHKCYTQKTYDILENFDYADTLIYRVIILDESQTSNEAVYMVWRDAEGKYLYMFEERFNELNPYQITLNGQTFSLEDNEINSTEALNILHTLDATGYVDSNTNEELYFPITTETVIESISINKIETLKVGFGLNVEMDYYVKKFDYDISQCTDASLLANWETVKNDKDAAYEDLKKEFNFDNVRNYETAYNKYLDQLNLILNNLKDPEKEKKEEEENV